MNIFSKDIEGPKVIINDKELEKELGRWLGIKGNVSKTFSEMLLNVGFKSNDEIVLYKYYYREDEYLSFSYIVNGKNPYKKNVIMLECENEFNNKPRIMVATGSKNTRSNVVYEEYRIDKDSKYQIVSYSYEDKKYGMLSRRYYETKAEFFVEKEDYELCLSITEPMQLFLKRNKDSVYQIKNEKELISYLNSLTFPVEIDLVYKKICEISLGDISEYPKFSLRVNKYDNIDGLEEVTDIIEVENGKLLSFGMTKNGKNIILDVDGSWTYEKKLSDRTAMVWYDKDDNSFVYGSIYDGGLDNRNKHEEININEIRDIAINDVDNTKRLVRSMFNK